MPQPSSAIDDEKGTRALSRQDQRIFDHWRKVLTNLTAFSPDDSLPSDRQSYSPKAIPPPPLPPTRIAAPGREHVAPVSIDKGDLVSSAQTRQQQREHKACVSVINRLFEKSPLIIFMNEHLRKVGCNVPVACAPCSGMKVRGGFDPIGGIVICQDNNWKKRTVESTLTHEMVHAFDHCRFQFDINNLKQIACSEVVSHVCRVEMLMEGTSKRLVWGV